MTTLITILALLFAALFILVTLAEKYGSRNEQSNSRLSRFIPLLVGLIILAQVIKFAFFSD